MCRIARIHLPTLRDGMRQTQKNINSLVTTNTTKPNFFLLGAGRCGSTTLYSMLRQHPQIFMPDIKEPSHFCSYFQVVKDPVSYFQLFNPVEGQTAIGEASHVYLSNPESAPVIHTLFPKARFILILRSPTERAYSLYQWTRKANLEPCETFEEALEVEGQRYVNADFFNKCPQYFWNFMYVRSSYFDVQWARYLRFYSPEQFFVLSLNELVANPVHWMQQIFRFLDVDSSFIPAIRHLNARECTPMLAETKQRLDSHFKATVAATNALAGRDLHLD
ncbi:sulfotransferase [Pokkaliibacter plantistimulans]|uniref:Sulfotransferase n=2 Tax=Pseudomonadota TaxID=1224 RepID=A0A2S5KXF2_9PROT|nr:sulfotransferase [Pokkaliibacter plantistimulans]